MPGSFLVKRATVLRSTKAHWTRLRRPYITACATRQKNCKLSPPFPASTRTSFSIPLRCSLCASGHVFFFLFVRYSNVLEALEDYFLFYSDDCPDKPAPSLPSLVQQSPKSAPLSPATMPLEHHDASIGASSADVLAVSAGANADDSSSGVKARRPSFISLQDLSDAAAVNEPSTSPIEKEKKGRWQGLLASTKVPSFPSSFSRRPSLQDDSILRVQRQTEKVMMRRLQASVTYKLALLESHMRRYEDAKVLVSFSLQFLNFHSHIIVFMQYHYESALRMYNDNPRHPRVAAIMLGLGCL